MSRRLCSSGTTAHEAQQGMRTLRTSKPRLMRRSKDPRQRTTRKASSSSTSAACRPSSLSLFCLRRGRPDSRSEPPSGARVAGTSFSRNPSSSRTPVCRRHLAQASERRSAAIVVGHTPRVIAPTYYWKIPAASVSTAARRGIVQRLQEARPTQAAARRESSVCRSSPRALSGSCSS